MPTISDVARAAGVGIGTVSRVLNRSELVSAATRQRVLEAIERLGHQPSPIEQALADTDYTLLVRTVIDAEDRDRVFEACCRRGRADAALLVWLPPTEAL